MADLPKERRSQSSDGGRVSITLRPIREPPRHTIAVCRGGSCQQGSGEEVAEGGEGMVKEHSGAGVAHDGAHAGGHIGAVAVDGTSAAALLALTERTPVEALAGVFQQRATFGT